MVRLTPNFKVSIALIATLVLGIASVSFSRDEALLELFEKNEDIQIINLLNGLDLNTEQMRSILRKAEQVKTLEERSTDEIRLFSSRLNELTDNIKGKVGEGKVKLDKELSGEFVRLEYEMKRIKRQTYEKIDKLALAVEAELEEFQLYALDNYIPCIVPVITNGRIGQSGSDERNIKLLERIRKIPAFRYNIKKVELIDNLLVRIKERIPPTIELDESEARIKISNIFDKVRAMEDVEFGINKDSLAEEFKESILPARKQFTRKVKIRKFLLSENIIPILKERLKVRAAY